MPFTDWLLRLVIKHQFTTKQASLLQHSFLFYPGYYFTVCIPVTSSFGREWNIYKQKFGYNYFLFSQHACKTDVESKGILRNENYSESQCPAWQQASFFIFVETSLIALAGCQPLALFKLMNSLLGKPAQINHPSGQFDTIAHNFVNRIAQIHLSLNSSREVLEAMTGITSCNGLVCRFCSNDQNTVEHVLHHVLTGSVPTQMFWGTGGNITVCTHGKPALPTTKFQNAIESAYQTLYGLLQDNLRIGNQNQLMCFQLEETLKKFAFP